MRILRLLRPYWHLLFLLIALTLLSAGMATLPPGLVRAIIDRALPGGDAALLVQSAAALGLALVGHEALRMGQEYTGALLGLRVTGAIRRQLWLRLMRTNLHFFTATPRGEILQRLLNDADAVRHAAVQTLPRTIYELAVAVAAAVAMVRIDGPLAAVAMGVVLLAALPSRRIGAVRQRISAQAREQQSAMYQQAQERLEAIRLVKGFTAEEREAARFQSLQLAWARLERKAFLIIQSFLNVPRILESLVPMLIYLIGGYQVFAGRLTVGALVAMAAYVPMVGAPIRSLAATYLALQEAAPKVRTVLEWLDLPEEPGRRRQRGPVALGGDIRFEAVSFTYPGAAQPVLDGVSFRIPAGARAAIIGPSGAGKSTILALLSRLCEPTGGRITVGGVPLTEIHPDDLRLAMAVVTQESFLLHDSIRRNLTFGLNRTVTDAELTVALGMASLLDLVASLPEGLATAVGERGLRLSGGERQRLALARAILRNPQLLLLDEATSALDNENQAAVQAAIGQVAEGRTTITVAHRLSTIADADLVIRLENGRVSEVSL